MADCGGGLWWQTMVVTEDVLERDEGEREREKKKWSL